MHEGGLMEGYIYILINPSLQKNYLKIGKTEISPEKRAIEISQGTGVPTPYHVAYKHKVSDCNRAETIIHNKLNQYRVSGRREFFLLSLDKAIEVVRDVGQNLPIKTEQHTYLEKREDRGYRKVTKSIAKYFYYLGIGFLIIFLIFLIFLISHI